MPILGGEPFGVGRIHTLERFLKATDHVASNRLLKVEGTVERDSVENEPTILQYLDERFEEKNLVMGVNHFSMKAPVTSAYIDGMNVLAVTLYYRGHTQIIGGAYLFNHLHTNAKSIVRLPTDINIVETRSRTVGNFHTIDEVPKDCNTHSKDFKEASSFFNNYQELSNLHNDYISDEANLVHFIDIHGHLITVGLWKLPQNIEEFLGTFCQFKPIPVTIENLSHGYWDAQDLVVALCTDAKGRKVHLTKNGCVRLQSKLVARFTRPQNLTSGWETIDALRIKEAH